MLTYVSNLFKQRADATQGSASNVSLVPLPSPRDASKLAIVVKNVFSQEECKAMIKDTECAGYDKALVNAGGGRQVLNTDYRKSSRCIVDSVEQAAEIWRRVKDYVPASWNHRGELWNVVGLNERLRFLRYSPGDFFSPHFDGTYQRENGDQSFITIQLYLNEDFKGGATTFLDIDSDAVTAVQPKTGSVLIFQHVIFHSGSIVSKGIKYAVRSDVMYRRA